MFLRENAHNSMEEESSCSGESFIPSDLDIHISEFCQNSSPVIHWSTWDKVKMQNENFDSFVWIISSQQYYPVINPLRSKSLTIRSRYGPRYYISCYFYALDIQSRGFARALSVCFSSLDVNTIEKIAGRLTEIKNIINMEIKKNHAKFKTDFIEYIKCVMSCRNQNLNTDTLNHMQGLIDEIALDLDIDQSEYKSIQSIPNAERIFQIQSYRLLSEVFCINNLVEKFKIFHQQNDPRVILLKNDFAIQSPFNNIFPTSSTYIYRRRDEFNSAKYKLYDSLRSETIGHILYTLLSGRTMLVQAEDIEAGRSFAERLSFFVPSFNENMILVSEKTINPFNNIQYAIIVAPNFSRNSENDDNTEKNELEFDDFLCSRFALLGVDNKYYIGPLNPFGGCVVLSKPLQSATSETTLLLAALSMVTSSIHRITRLCMAMAVNVPTNPERVRAICGLFRLSECDMDIVRFWTMTACSKKKSRVIFTDYDSGFRCAIGVTTY